MLLAYRKYLLIDEPVIYIGVGRIREGALVVVELLLLPAALVPVLEQLRKTYLAYLPEIVRTQLLNEGVAFGGNLEEDGADG